MAALAELALARDHLAAGCVGMGQQGKLGGTRSASSLPAVCGGLRAMRGRREGRTLPDPPPGAACSTWHGGGRALQRCLGLEMKNGSNCAVPGEEKEKRK